MPTCSPSMIPVYHVMLGVGVGGYILLLRTGDVLEGGSRLPVLESIGILVTFLLFGACTLAAVRLVMFRMSMKARVYKGEAQTARVIESRPSRAGAALELFRSTVRELSVSFAIGSLSVITSPEAVSRWFSHDGPWVGAGLLILTVAAHFLSWRELVALARVAFLGMPVE